MDRVHDAVDLLSEVAPSSSLLVDHEVAKQLALRLVMLISNEDSVVVAAALTMAETVDTLDQVRHGDAVRVIWSGVAFNQARFRDATKNDPAFGCHERLKHCLVDRYSCADRLLHRQE